MSFWLQVRLLHRSYLVDSEVRRSQIHSVLVTAASLPGYACNGPRIYCGRELIGNV